MTGTPLDLTPFGPLLSALGLLYWLLAIALIAFALWYPNRWLFKLPLAALVLVAFAYPVVRHAQLQQVQSNESQARLDAAMALFAERCRTAGERIVRTVEGVEGVVLMKWRPERTNYADQFKLDDPYGRDCGGEDCIGLLLRVTGGAKFNPEEAARHQAGYRFVETTDPRDGKRYRYTAHLAHGWSQEAIERHTRENGSNVPAYSYRFKIDRVPIDNFSARYGMTWEDISTREDRGHWIAGSSLKVVDLQTNEIIAERIGYMVDQGQGSQTGFRSPWLFAQQTACPEFPPIGQYDPRRLRSGAETQNFATKVLNPTQGE